MTGKVVEPIVRTSDHHIHTQTDANATSVLKCVVNITICSVIYLPMHARSGHVISLLTVAVLLELEASRYCSIVISEWLSLSSRSGQLTIYSDGGTCMCYTSVQYIEQCR